MPTKHYPFYTIDCSKISDFRGLDLCRCLLLNYEGLDFNGAVLYGCYPSVGQGATDVQPLEKPPKFDGRFYNVQIQRASIEGHLRPAHLMYCRYAVFSKEYVIPACKLLWGEV